MTYRNGGEGGIRTHGTVSRTLAFEASTFNRSVTSPRLLFFHCSKAIPCAAIAAQTAGSSSRAFIFRSAQRRAAKNACSTAADSSANTPAVTLTR
jgi:hypothetical protein